ncbi:cytochrome b/b6 domain-containing protein [Pelosinus sp. IPA-1]|uniref:cytochrome b/b6 domain-containing protein n=1 Tax=Pelosinus sp. IPA-1 TaxID=3029569 RepID=UPI0024362248|nr:cytochrome b/b6 domain-containing protein [Pelosinus sp. IPA-1]GMA97782.1 cytochrome b561 [Pelosinus sp. IPA-1]
MKLLLHPLPIRIFHWVLFICIMVLLFTGLYINRAWDMVLLPMRVNRKLHTLFSAVLIVNLMGHLYYYLYTRKITDVIFTLRDWVNIPSFLRYVFFIKPDHPNFGRYNPGQKLLFSFWFLTIIIAAITGIILLFPENSQWFQRMLGGLNIIRILHFYVGIFFAMSIPLHLYLVFTESPANLQAMFTGYINKDIKPEIIKKEKEDPSI